LGVNVVMMYLLASAVLPGLADFAMDWLGLICLVEVTGSG
jgi:hypothetical protein